MIITKNENEFLKKFVLELGKFTKEQKKKAKQNGLTEEEFLAITSNTFNILGKNYKHFKKEANIN